MYFSLLINHFKTEYSNYLKKNIYTDIKKKSSLVTNCGSNKTKFNFYLFCSCLSTGYIYQFQQDGYLMRGCPRIRDCPGRKIESKCRMPTTFITESGRKCRGCPRNFCTNNMFRALRTPGMWIFIKIEYVDQSLTHINRSIYANKIIKVNWR